MHGLTDARTVGWTDGRTDGWKDRWAGGWTDIRMYIGTDGPPLSTKVGKKKGLKSTPGFYLHKRINR